MITLEVNGEEYTGFTEVSAGKRLNDLVGEFSFVATSEQKIVFPFKNGDFVTVRTDGLPVISGYIDQFGSDYSTDDSGNVTHTVTFDGRGKAADIVDSFLYETIEVEGQTTLKAIIEQVITLLGMDQGQRPIKVIDNSGTAGQFTQSQKVSSEPAQNAWEFILNFARRLQVLITDDGNGDIVITRTPTEAIPFVLLNEEGNELNNIKAAGVTYRDQDRYGKYIVMSSQSGGDLNFGSDTNVQESTNRNAEFIDQELDGTAVIRTSRVFAMVAEASMTSSQCEDRARWECNLRKAEAREYRCTVQGHSYQPEETVLAAWMPGLQVQVSDELCGITDVDTLLINAVAWTYDLDNGSETSMVLTDKEAYSLTVEGENRDAQESTGEGGIVQWRDPK